MDKGTGFLVADLCDIIAYTAYANVSTTEVLNWVYTVVLIASVVFGIVMKIVSYARDGRITKKEAEDLKKTLEDGAETLKEEKEHQEERK